MKIKSNFSSSSKYAFRNVMKGVFITNFRLFVGSRWVRQFRPMLSISMIAGIITLGTLQADETLKMQPVQLAINDGETNVEIYLGQSEFASIKDALVSLASHAEVIRKEWEAYIEKHPELKDKSGWEIQGPHTRFNLFILGGNTYIIDIFPIDADGKLVGVQGPKDQIEKVEKWFSSTISKFGKISKRREDHKGHDKAGEGSAKATE